MASTPPAKEDLLQTLRDANATLTEDMQRAAVKRSQELGFNLNAGIITIEEILINLTQNRNTIADAINSKTLTQLPLKLQYDLLAKTQRIAETLQNIINSADAISILDEAVEDQGATIWQYHLNYLSDQVLGYEQKMNQLKAQEVLLAQATHDASTFLATSAQHNERLKDLERHTLAADKQLTAITTTAERAITALDAITATEQRGNALLTTLQQYDGTAAQYLANAKTAAVEATSTTKHINDLQPTIEQMRRDLDNLTTDNRTLTTTANNTIEQLKRETNDLQTRLTDDITTLRTTTQEHIGSATDELNVFMTTTKDRLEQAGDTQQNQLDTQLTVFTKRTDDAITASNEKTDTVIAHNEQELKRLTTELGTLEESIRDVIERATGYSLFHAFQKRQEALAKSKLWWAIALGVAVAASVVASAYVIHEIHSATAVNSIFFLKLSISLPLIYAITFCSLQYARERRLEEEYAFKSSISISLDPYQRLVEKLVSKDNPEEQAKYTAFVIESIGRVFTSPTSHVFEDKPPTDKNGAEKIIKAIGDLIEPVIKAVRK